MEIQLSTLIWLLLASAFILSLLGIYAWKRRGMPGATPFALLMLAAMLWALSNAFEMSALNLPIKLFWANFQYICYATIPILWFILVIQFGGFEAWLTPLRLALLWIIPLITIILVWTNNLHGLMRYNVYLDTNGPFPVIGKSYGPWAYVHFAYSYLIFAATFYLLIKTIRKSQPAFRDQPFVLLISLLLPLLWNILYVFQLSPIRRHDLSPAILSISGLIASWALFRYRLFDILPLAHDALLVSISDGVIVLDANLKIAALNPAINKIFGWSEREISNQPACEVFQSWPGLTDLLQQSNTDHWEFELEIAPTLRYFDLSLSPLLDQYGRSVGKLMIFHDITSRKKVEEELRTLSTTDALTGLGNRRKFFENLHIEIEQSRRYKTPLTLILMDVNGFKTINDTYGHAVGDEALREVGQLLQKLRQADIAARYGGDEFVILCPLTPLSGAEQLAVRLLENVRNICVGDNIAVSLSLGIAMLEPNDDELGESLIQRADRAMYLARQNTQGYQVLSKIPPS